MKLRASPLLVAVVIVLAFVLGSVSTAVAGPVLTRGAVKKIAAKAVKKAAPKLSVAHAVTATNATSLNGLAADAYLDRVAFAGGGSSVAVTGGVDVELVALDLTVPPAGSFVRITGSLTFDTPGAPNLATLWAAVDKTCPDPTGVGFQQRVQMSMTSIRDRGTVDFVTTLAPGVHHIRLCGLAQASGNAIGPQLVAQTIARNGVGGAP